MPSAPSTSFMCLASRWAARVVAVRSSSPISIRSAECSRGTTSACPGVAGLMSMKATVRSSESIVSLGIVPAMMAQKRQSGSAIRAGAYCPKGARVAALAEPPCPLERLVPACDLAGERLGAKLLEQPAELRSGVEAELTRQLVPRERGSGRAVVVPGEGIAKDLPGEVQVRLDHLGARQRALPPGGE